MMRTNEALDFAPLTRNGLLCLFFSRVLPKQNAAMGARWGVFGTDGDHDRGGLGLRFGGPFRDVEMTPPGNPGSRGP